MVGFRNPGRGEIAGQCPGVRHQPVCTRGAFRAGHLLVSWIVISEALADFLILSETDSAGSLGAPGCWRGVPGEALYAHLSWVWIFKELDRLHKISEVLGEGLSCRPAFL